MADIKVDPQLLRQYGQSIVDYNVSLRNIYYRLQNIGIHCNIELESGRLYSCKNYLINCANYIDSYEEFLRGFDPTTFNKQEVNSADIPLPVNDVENATKTNPINKYIDRVLTMSKSLGKGSKLATKGFSKKLQDIADSLRFALGRADRLKYLQIVDLLDKLDDYSNALGISLSTLDIIKIINTILEGEGLKADDYAGVISDLLEIYETYRKIVDEKFSGFGQIGGFIDLLGALIANSIENKDEKNNLLKIANYKDTYMKFADLIKGSLAEAGKIDFGTLWILFAGIKGGITSADTGLRKYVDYTSDNAFTDFEKSDWCIDMTVGLLYGFTDSLLFGGITAIGKLYWGDDMPEGMTPMDNAQENAKWWRDCLLAVCHNAKSKIFNHGEDYVTAEQIRDWRREK